MYGALVGCLSFRLRLLASAFVEVMHGEDALVAGSQDVGHTFGQADGQFVHGCVVLQQLLQVQLRLCRRCC